MNVAVSYDERLQSHPNMIKIDSICPRGFTPTMVYEFNALDTLRNLLIKDSFSWHYRVKVAVGIASLLKCMHGCTPLPYLLRNISAAHIIVDQDYNAKIFDFSMISGGILIDKTDLLNQHLQGCYGYIDPDYGCHGKWSEKCDVFAFGVVLIGLVSKKVPFDTDIEGSYEPFLYEWAHSERRKKCPGFKSVTSRFSLVHKSLESDPFFLERDGVALTQLAMQCVDSNPKKRPTMKKVVSCLWELVVVQNHADLLSLGDEKDVPRPTISELCPLMFKKLKVSLNMIEKASMTLFNYQSSKDNLVLADKGEQYLPPKRLSYEDIKSYTNGFCEENFINTYGCGKLYHGNIDGLKVTVRTWEELNRQEHNKIRMRDELIVHQHPKFVSHPHVAKLIGYCYEDEKLGAVYNLQSLDSLFNLISDDCFTWQKRIIFILELAKLIEYLQQKNSPYVLRNISPRDILVDKHYMPKLFNFGTLLGGLMNDQRQYRIKDDLDWDYYTDPHTNCYDYYTEVSDIYSLGFVMLNVITRICNRKDDSDIKFDEWVCNEFESAKLKGRKELRRFSLADGHFDKEVGFNPCDGRRVTRLAMQCIDCDYKKRPTIRQVLKQLKKLKSTL